MIFIPCNMGHFIPISKMSSPLPSFKVVLMGPAEVGKTAFVKRMRTGEFGEAGDTYLPTIGVDVHPITFNITEGLIRLNVWDCAGKPRLRGLGDGYLIAADAVILMFDLTDEASFRELKEYQETVKFHVPDVPLVICGNKADCKHREVSSQKISILKKESDYYDVSAKSNYNFEKPWLYLLRKLTGISELGFSEEEHNDKKVAPESGNVLPESDSEDEKTQDSDNEIDVLLKELNNSLTELKKASGNLSRGMSVLNGSINTLIRTVRNSKNKKA
jgi:GTP-binding nuclear protein Ran